MTNFIYNKFGLENMLLPAKPTPGTSFVPPEHQRITERHITLMRLFFSSSTMFYPEPDETVNISCVEGLNKEALVWHRGWKCGEASSRHKSTVVLLVVVLLVVVLFSCSQDSQFPREHIWSAAMMVRKCVQNAGWLLVKPRCLIFQRVSGRAAKIEVITSADELLMMLHFI